MYKNIRMSIFVVIMLLTTLSISKAQQNRDLTSNIRMGNDTTLGDTFSTVALGSTEKDQSDSFKVNLSNIAFDGYFELIFEIEDTTTDHQGKNPSIELAWQYWDYINNRVIYHPDSTTNAYYLIEDSVKQYQREMRWKIEPEMTGEGILVLVKYSDNDTGWVSMRRETKYMLQLNGR